MPTAAIIQLNSGDDRAANLTAAGRIMTAAAERGAGLLVLPETFAFMSNDETLKRRHDEDPDNGPSLDFLRTFAARHRVWIVGGSIALRVKDGDKATNTCFVVDDRGGIRARYDKIHLFDAKLGREEPYRESDHIQPGKRPVVVHTPFGVLGLSICYDLRFPELYRALTAAGATILVVPAAFTLTTGAVHWELLLRARAVENFAHVLGAGQWGTHPGGRRTYGHSMAVEPWGTVTSRHPDGTGFILADLDPERVERCRHRLPCLEHRVDFPLDG